MRARTVQVAALLALLLTLSAAAGTTWHAHSVDEDHGPTDCTSCVLGATQVEAASPSGNVAPPDVEASPVTAAARAVRVTRASDDRPSRAPPTV